MHIRTQLKLAAAFVAILLTTGCSTTPNMRVIDTGEELSIVHNANAGELEVVTGNSAAAQGAVAGGGAGLATGAMTGLACGPFAPACVPMAGLSFGVIGAMGGSIIAAATSLNDEDEAAILEQLNNYLDAEDPNAALRQQLGQQLDTRWDVVGEADSVVGVALTRIALRGDAGGKFTLIIQADAYADDCLDCVDSRRAEGSFVYKSRGISAESWIANDYDFVKSEVHLALSGLAADIDKALAKR